MIRGLIAGVMGLTLAQAMLSTETAAQQQGGTSSTDTIIDFVSRGLERWLNPFAPLIPDLRPAQGVPGTQVPGQPPGTIYRGPTTGATYVPPAASGAGAAGQAQTIANQVPT